MLGAGLPFPGYIWKPFKEIIHAAGLTGSDVELIADPAPSPGFRVYTRYTVLDVTTDFDQIRVVTRGRGQDQVYAEEETLTADDPYWDNWPIICLEGERLVAILEGTTTGDQLRLFVEGLEFWPAPIPGEVGHADPGA